METKNTNNTLWIVLVVVGVALILLMLWLFMSKSGTTQEYTSIQNNITGQVDQNPNTNANGSDVGDSNSELSDTEVDDITTRLAEIAQIQEELTPGSEEASALIEEQVQLEAELSANENIIPEGPDFEVPGPANEESINQPPEEAPLEE